MKRLNTRRRITESEQACLVDVPRGHISQCTSSLVFELHAPASARSARPLFVTAFARLYARLLVGAEHIVVRAQRGAFPASVIEVEHPFGPFAEVLCARKNPASVRPGFDRVGAQPAPHRRAADCGNEAALHGLPRDLRVAQPRQRNPQLAWQLTRQRLDLNRDLRGKNGAVDRAWAGPPNQQDRARKTASATC